MPSIEENKNSWDGHYDWKYGGEEWSHFWGSSWMLWHGTLRPRIARYIPCETIVEIAPGFGRISQFLIPLSKNLIAVDLAEKCVKACRERFAALPSAKFVQGDGKSLKEVATASADFVISWDSLVHVTGDVLNGYIDELKRILKPGCSAFLHHGNLGSYVDASTKQLVIENKHWRDVSVSAATVRKHAQSIGLHCVSQELVHWYGNDLTDCFTTFRQPARKDEPPVETNVVVHPWFANEIAHFGWLNSVYGMPKPDKPMFET